MTTSPRPLSADHLGVLVAGAWAGSLAQDDRGRLRLTYDESWRTGGAATPLSLSMPLGRATHDDDAVRAFLWGLLPDNDQVLQRWAQSFQVSAGNPFALLRAVGEDCAGALQLVVPERIDALLAGQGGIDWLDEHDVAARLRRLRRDPTAWHTTATGQFCLAGAKAKTALHYDGRTSRWGAPRGALPTTHILKPAVSGFDGHDLNEHLCLATARRLGLDVATSRVVSFGDERAIVLERYDRRRRPDGTIERTHQEDLCQALGVMPALKYQDEGGPAPEQVVRLLREVASPESVPAFVDALALNWLLAGTDAHAKNYSLLLSGDQVRLAPLYDVASALPYEDMRVPKPKMAMQIGGEHRIARITTYHWRRLAEAVGLEADAVLGRIDALAVSVPEHMAAAADDPDVRSLGADLPQRLVDQVTAWAATCRRAIA